MDSHVELMEPRGNHAYAAADITVATSGHVRADEVKMKIVPVVGEELSLTADTLHHDADKFHLWVLDPAHCRMDMRIYDLPQCVSSGVVWSPR